VDDVYALILEQAVYVDIRRQLITDIFSCGVSLSKELLNASLGFLDVQDSSDISVGIDRIPDAKNLEKALERLDLAESGCTTRHARRLRRRKRLLKSEGKTSLQAMVMPRRGNCRDKISMETKTYLRVHIREHYMSPQRPSLHAAWTNYNVRAKLKHPDESPVVIKTYKKYVEMENAEAVARARGGRRSGNSAASATTVATRQIQATRPFERGSIDHTKLKIMVKVVESGGESYAKKPWLTILVDEFSGYWISFFLSFKGPSKRSLAMLFRNCVREHGKLHEMIHSDRGSDFRSVYYRSLLAHYDITASWSPAENSRCNSLAEIVNKRIKDQWLARRPGNTVDFKNERKISKGHRPQDLAVLDLRDLFLELETYRNSYNSTVIGTRSSSPHDIFYDGLKLFDFSGIPVEVNEEFMLATAYDTNHSEYQIGPNHDIQFQGLHYSHVDLKRLTPKRSKTELRIDPENPYKVYCCVEGKWVPAYQSKYQSFKNQAPAARWAEAIIVGDGRPDRDKAKQHGHDARVEEIEKYDKAYLDKSYSEIAMKDDMPPSPQEYKADSSKEILEALMKNLMKNSNKGEG